MTHAYGLVGIGRCPAHGSNVQDFLFVHSEYETKTPRCYVCWLSGVGIDAINFSDYPIIADTPFCESCGCPETDSDPLVMGTGITTTHKVHSACIGFTCTDCALQFVRHTGWFRGNRYERAGNMDIQTTPCEMLNRDSYCQPCAKKYMDRQGGEANFRFCNACESAYHLDHIRNWDADTYCNRCCDANINECSDCNTEYWGDHHPDCSESEQESRVIYDYSYKPRPIFHGVGRYHMGFELEVEARGNTSREEGAEMTRDKLTEDVAYMKQDGSLNDGFEIVTHPHTLEAYQSTFDWEFLPMLRRKGFRSWDRSSCGLHVHVSREAFRNPSWTSGNAHMLRFMKLIYDNQRQVERIAGRSNAGYATFADKGSLVRKVKEGRQSDGHSSAVNVENNATIEIRVFKGSLRKERVLSALEFVTASVEYTRTLKVTGKNKSLSWLHFTGYISRNEETYPNLALIMSEVFLADRNPIDMEDNNDDDEYDN